MTTRPGIIGLLLALLAGGCGTTDPDFSLLAASSLTEVAPQLTDAYHREQGELDIVHDFAGSNSLATQIIEGRRADVLLTADEASMARAVDAGAITGDPVVFARNRLVIVVPPGNPAGVTTLSDLADPDLLVAICAPDVPCGDLTARAAADQGVVIRADTLDPSVRSVLTRVQSESVDAGVVYVTDARAAAGSVETLALPGGGPTGAPYLAAAVDGSDPDATGFVDWLTTEPAQAILGAAGFEQP